MPSTSAVLQAVDLTLNQMTFSSRAYQDRMVVFLETDMISKATGFVKRTVVARENCVKYFVEVLRVLRYC